MSSLGLAILLEQEEYDSVVLVGLCLQLVGLQGFFLYLQLISEVFFRHVKILIQLFFFGGNRECTPSSEICVWESTVQDCLL